ncbi:hypothetical protein [Bradyrhizobium sp. AZCC 2230]|uniref:hypothetical protein n=1 Tax=Bradyrhizobium sp. AZCC 2230 TaxID=3117021 RepID=UPI002FF071C6
MQQLRLNVSLAGCLLRAKHDGRRTRPGSPIDVTLYPGATHDFDEPPSRRQSAPGNQAAMDDALVKAASILDGWKK